jgi:uncharacterized protein with PIN domain
MHRSYNHAMNAIAEVAAVHDDQALEFLDRLGLRSSYENGELACAICGSPLVEAGLGAVRGVGGDEFEFSCAKLDCQDEFHSR